MIHSGAVTCDVCGVAKQSTNHWWAVLVLTGSVVIEPWEIAEGKGHLKKPTTHHLCGQGHVHTLVDQLISDHVADSRKKEAIV